MGSDTKWKRVVLNERKIMFDKLTEQLKESWKAIEKQETEQRARSHKKRLWEGVWVELDNT